jgi:glutamate-1-semialdehyde aminotransferase/spore coat polysaccharide biosynthesis protein SpsF (cytidylyltransferase family)
MRTVAIIQARTQSSRFPRKVLKKLSSGETILEFLTRRLWGATQVQEVIVATTTDVSDDAIEALCQELGVFCFRGSESDVLTRFAEGAKVTGADVVVRITADCPLVDPQMLDAMLRQFHAEELDYLCNQDPPRLPDGLDIDIFSRALLDFTSSTATSNYDREHVTPFMKKVTGFKIGQFYNESDLSRFRVTLDTPEDLKAIKMVLDSLSDRNTFNVKDVATALERLEQEDALPKMIQVPQSSRGAKLYDTAKRLIPGGNSLLSKRPEMFLPGHWPNYFDRAEGISVWDLDGQNFRDMSIMGIGTNTLGYANKKVDEAVSRVVAKSNMSTLNPPEEVFLADRLLDMHPWFSRARFARTGAEANAIALRIARVASGRTKVAVCGYHGWHDWYLALNISNPDLLGQHLIPGLSAAGVPSGLGSEISSFSYNNFDEMRLSLGDSQVGVVFMEVMRSQKPQPGFLEEIRELTKRNNQVLIFDECTSGFRETFGGLHKRFGIHPDMAVFGKALGNGYAITAVLGTEEVMDSAETTFMSSTFWSERIGFAAALATLDEMEAQVSWEVITSLGAKMKEAWEQAFDAIRDVLPVQITGLDALAAFGSSSVNFLPLKTLIVQEMLGRHQTLASNIFYPSTAHTDSDISEYGMQLKTIIGDYLDSIIEGKIDRHLAGGVAHSQFGRLN